MYSSKNVPASHVLAPSSGSDFNNLAGEGESLMKMMKDRGCKISLTQWIYPKTKSKK